MQHSLANVKHEAQQYTEEKCATVKSEMQLFKEACLEEVITLRRAVERKGARQREEAGLASGERPKWRFGTRWQWKTSVVSEPAEMRG